MSKVWEFIKKHWVALVAFLGTVVGAAFLLDKKEKDKTASAAAEEARKAKELAEQQEAARIAEAKRLAELQKQIDDEKARKDREETEKKIDKQVEENVKNDLENPDKLAEDFANTFGGINVKNDEK